MLVVPRQVKVTVVELDPVMVRCAEEWFGLEQCEEMKVVVGDGVEYMKNTLLQGKKGEGGGRDGERVFNKVFTQMHTVCV